MAAVFALILRGVKRWHLFTVPSSLFCLSLFNGNQHLNDPDGVRPCAKEQSGRTRGNRSKLKEISLQLDKREGVLYCEGDEAQD